MRHGQQLRDLLRRYFPELLSLRPRVNEPWFGGLIEMTLIPADVKKLKRGKLKQLLSQHRIRRHSGG